jgi:hypothetical protein
MRSREDASRLPAHESALGTALGILALGALGLGLLDAPAARSEDPSAWYQQITVNGMVSTSFNHNFNQPDSRTNGYRVFDSKEGDFQLDAAELAIQRAALEPGQAGFNVHLTAGSAIPPVTASTGMFRDADGTGQNFDVHQALATYIAPIGKGLRLDFGKHVSHMGYEVIEGYDGVNDQATRSFLFGYAVPFTHTGLRAGYAFSPKFATTLYLVNGWDNVRDNNGAKTVGAQAALTPSGRFGLYLNYLGGAEQDDNTSNLRHTIDVVTTVKAGDRLALGLNLDYGTEANAVVSSEDVSWREDVSWMGGALYARMGLSETFALTARAESFDDEDGFRTGKAQTLQEITLTPEWKPTRAFLLRLDLRADRSDKKVFEDGDQTASSKSQNTVTLNAIYTF